MRSPSESTRSANVRYLWTEPRFAIDSFVYTWGSDRKQKKAAVVNTYDFESNWRYVVKFEDGTDGVFFEFELKRASDC
jgi:hypothetical protein